MRFCLVSTDLQQATGYSKVAYNLMRTLQQEVCDKGKDLSLFHYAAQSNEKTLPFRPALGGIVVKQHIMPSSDEFGFKGLNAFCEEHSIDVVMIYNDIAVSLTYLQEWCPPRLWVYLDTVAHGIPTPLLKMLDEKAERIYLFNDYWKSVYPFKQVRVLEHGVDTEVFKPIAEEEKADLRKKLGIPKDALVFFNANRNSKRKRIDLTISAFVQFSKRNPTKNAYLLLMLGGKGFYDVATILYSEISRHRHDCSKKVLTIQTDKQLFTDVAMNQFYNIADIGLNTSTGEGFGLTALEHVSVGKPQVLTHLPVYETFLSKRNVVFVPPLGDREYYEQTEFSGSFHETWSSADIATGMENAVGKRVKYTPKSWEEVMKGFIGELMTDAPPPPPSPSLPVAPPATADAEGRDKIVSVEVPVRDPEIRVPVLVADMPTEEAMRM
jgi:glycosyltransferase involved in cell wall biosynthesis